MINIFFELCRLFCDLHGRPCRTTCQRFYKKKYPVKTDTIENNISLRVICETIFLYFVATWGICHKSVHKFETNKLSFYLKKKR